MTKKSTVTKTFDDIIQFTVAATTFNKKNPVNAQTKLGYAIQKLSGGQLQKINEEFGAERQKLWEEMVGMKQIDLALTDKATGAVLTAPKDSDRKYLYDKAGLKEIMKVEKEFSDKLDALFNEFKVKEYELEPHYAVELPEGLTEDEIKVFTGFVIAPTE